MAPQRNFVQVNPACRGNVTGPADFRKDCAAEPQFGYSARSSARKSSKVSSSNWRSGEFSLPRWCCGAWLRSAPLPRRAGPSHTKDSPLPWQCGRRPSGCSSLPLRTAVHSSAPGSGAPLFSASAGYLQLSSSSPLMYRGTAPQSAAPLICCGPPLRSAAEMPQRHGIHRSCLRLICGARPALPNRGSL